MNWTRRPRRMRLQTNAWSAWKANFANLIRTQISRSKLAGLLAGTTFRNFLLVMRRYQTNLVSVELLSDHWLEVDLR